jgi:hypothetical protein
VASDGGWPNASPILSGLFGSLQQAAQNHLPTSDLWSTLRIQAATWQHQTTGQGDLPADDVLEQQGRSILASQGVGIQQVNTYRAVANQWLSARSALAAASPTDQIRADQIFTPPWAQTTSDAVPSRYRVRVNWEITPNGGDPFNKWGAYETSNPLTTIQDVLDQASALVGKKPTSDVPLGAQVSGISDYELEQI